MASVEREDTSTSSFGRSILPSQWARPSLTPDPHSLRNPSTLFSSSPGLTKSARLLGRGFCTRTSLLEMCCLAPERFRLEVDIDPALRKPRPESSFRNADGMESFPTCKLHLLYQHVNCNRMVGHLNLRRQHFGFHSAFFCWGYAQFRFRQWNFPGTFFLLTFILCL